MRFQVLLAFLGPACWAQVSLPLVGVGAPGGPPPHVATLVQQAQGTWSTGASFTVTMGAAPASGNLMTITINMDKAASAAPTVLSISSTNTTWTLDGAVTRSNSGGFIDVELWHGTVSGVGGTVITVNLSASTATTGSGSAVEWSGPNGSVDGATITRTGLTNPCLTNAYSTTTNDLVIVFCGTNNSHPINSNATNYTALTASSTTARSSYLTPAPVGAQASASWNITAGSGAAWATVTVGYVVP